ncbi:MAG: ABC transporter permease [Desulfobacterales bacterium]|nr:ABC transporter permease [Desulfobacterales bacterium]
MNKIFAIAVNTFRESIRDKIFYSLLTFAILMLGFSKILSNIAIGDSIKIIKDFGLASISLFGTLIAIFVGIGLVYKEMEKRTIFVILAKPIERWQFLVGKYLGLSITIIIEVVVMTIALFSLCYLYNSKIPWSLFYAIIPIFFELQLILAVAIFFSSFSSPFLSGLFTLGIFIIGHCSIDIKAIADKTDDVLLKKICDFFYYLLPNLENLNFKAKVVHDIAISFTGFWFSILYSVAYTVFILVCAIVIFEYRDMK